MLVSVCIAFLAQGPVRGAEVVRGLDLIVLVDVSRSMRVSDEKPATPGGKTARPDGSDPTRLRWDAVKLAIDLLTVEDRVLVLPFNERAPAVFRYPDGHDVLVPGKLPTGLQPLGQAALRRQLVDLVSTFIHDNDEIPNTDTGSTGIVNVLQVASQFAGRPAAGRKPAVLLLTDGEDRTGIVEQRRLLEGEENLRRTLPFYAGGAHEGVPVYAVGLGPDAKADLLLRIAKLSGGSFWRAQTNRDLIGIFRRLIWDLKGIWILEVKGEGVTGAKPMRGIVDLGALCYEETSRLLPDGQPDPRTYDAPSPPPECRWTGQPAGAVLPEQIVRTGKNNRGYSYFYYGRSALYGRDREQPLPSPFAQFNADNLELQLQWSGGDKPRGVFFAKRTEEPLFTIAEPAEHERLYRNHGVKVRVQMRQSEFFRPDEFQLKAMLLRAEPEAAIDGSSALVERPLKATPGSGDFICELPLADLPPSKEPVDYYTLAVTAEGLEQPGHSLSGYRLGLPRRTVAVDNTLLLEPIKAIALTRDMPVERIHLASQFPVQGQQQLRLRLVPPRRGEAPLDFSHLKLFVGGAEVHDGKGDFSLDNGQAEIAIGLNTEQMPAGGVAYANGSIEITGGEGVRVAALSTAVEIRIDTVSARLLPAALSIKSAAEPTRSTPVKVTLDPPGQSTTGIKSAMVRLKAPDGGHVFEPSELWLQADGPPVAPAERRQTAHLEPLSMPVVLYFQPRPGHKPGGYDYHLLGTASGMNDLEATAKLFITPPELELRAREVVVHVQPGETGTAAFAARLRAQPGVTEDVYLSSDEGDARLKFVRLGDNDTELDEGSVLLSSAFANRKNPVRLAGGDEAADANWSDLNVQVELPADTPCGIYQTHLTLSGQDVEDVRLTLKLIVDRLTIELEDAARPESQPDGDSANWVQLFERKMIRSVRVKSTLGRPLSAEGLTVSVAAPFSDERGDVLAVPTVAEVRSLGGSEGVRVSFAFARTVNAHPCQCYSLKAFFEAPELMLGRSELNMRVWFVDPEQLIQSQPVASADAAGD